jgi:hypothetical protein
MIILVIKMSEYYHYISESKVEMIFSRISHSKKEKTANEVGVDLKVIKAIFKKESEVDTHANKYEKVNFVSHYIKQNKKVSGVLGEGQWFSEGHFPLIAVSPKSNENILLYISKLSDRSYLILAGSKKNAIGGYFDHDDPASYSYQYDVIKNLEDLVEMDFDFLEKGHPKSYLDTSRELGIINGDTATTEFNKEWGFGSTFNIVQSIWEYSRKRDYLILNHSFLAKKLVVTRHIHRANISEENEQNEYSIVIGAPIYVADPEE